MDGALNINFTKAFPKGPTIAVDLEIETMPPNVTVLFGPSGSGKTTLLRALAGLDQITSGTICFGDETWADAARAVHLPPQERRVGFLFQDYALFPHLNIAHNIQFGLRHLPAREAEVRVAELLRRFQLEGLALRYPHQLSGGQKQRAALARTLAPKPRLLLLDEPLSALDAPTREAVRDNLSKMLRGLQIPVIIVTHDRTEALALGDHLAVMDQGEILQYGPVEEVFRRPSNQHVARIVGVGTVVAGRIQRIHEGMTTVSLGNTHLSSTTSDLPPDVTKVLVCIRAEDVILFSGEETVHVSARNRLRGVIQSLTREGPMLRIQLDCGFPLSALLTRQACEELALSEGNSVVALIKAPNVHLVPRS